MSESYGWNQDISISLLLKLKADLKRAMLQKDSDAKNTIRQVMSEFPKLTVPITLESGKKTTRCKKNDEITDDDILSLIRKLLKSEMTVLELKKEQRSPFQKILELYLPQMADKETITAWIKENIDLAAFKSPMQAMGPIMKHFGKNADGNLVKEVLAEMAKG